MTIINTIPQTITLQHDATITITTGKDRMATVWTPQTVTLSHFYSKLATVAQTAETMAEYAAYPKKTQHAVKDMGAYITARFNGTQRKRDAVIERTAITLDADFAQNVQDFWDTYLMFFGYNALIHTTHSHTTEAPRARLVVPSSRGMNLREYSFISHKMADFLNTKLFDPSTIEPERMMFWSSVCRDGEFLYFVHDAPLLDPDAFLLGYPGWQSLVPEFPTDWRIESESLNVPTEDKDTKSGWPYKWMQEQYVDGTRHDAINGALGVLFKPPGDGIHPSLVWQLIKGFNAIFEPPMDEEEAFHAYKSYLRRERKANGNRSGTSR
jgi:hypothetical protein